MKIGIDFDNTLIDYNDVFHGLARAHGWVSAKTPKTKEAVKRLLLRRDGNDLRWQALQALAYGREIKRAHPFAGAMEFIAAALKAGHEIVVISHKTRRSNYDPAVSLHAAAEHWIRAHLKAIPRRKIFFETSRARKLARIRSERCDIFVDDLLEVLEDRRFPENTHPLLFTGKNWDELRRFVLFASETGLECAHAFSDRFGAAPLRWSLLRRTGNNQIFKVKAPSGKTIALKKYFSGSAEKRNRSRSEFEAARLLRKKGMRQVPEPIHYDLTNHFAFYEFIEGRALADRQITDRLLKQAADFLIRLFKLARKCRLADAGPAGDARFSLSGYVAVIDRRMKEIERGVARLPRTAPARKFVERRLRPARDRIISRFMIATRKGGYSLKAVLKKSERVLSPSDFGFHNALVDSRGKITFIDFEYFGWDDPAKLVADFFHAVGQDLSQKKKQRFIEYLREGLPGNEKLFARWKLVDELIGFEWVLIVLNVLTAEGMARKRFANPGINAARLVRERLTKASSMLDAMASGPASHRGRSARPRRLRG